jgi:hypothetical protein
MAGHRRLLNLLAGGREAASAAMTVKSSGTIRTKVLASIFEPPWCG